MRSVNCWSIGFSFFLLVSVAMQFFSSSNLDFLHITGLYPLEGGADGFSST